MSHLRHPLPMHPAPIPTNVHYAPLTTKMVRCRESSDVLKADHERYCISPLVRRAPLGEGDVNISEEMRLAF